MEFDVVTIFLVIVLVFNVTINNALIFNVLMDNNRVI